MIKMKKGNTRSVGVSPCQVACLRGAYTLDQEPGLFTRIINAMVMPRITSNDKRRFERVAIMFV